MSSTSVTRAVQYWLPSSSPAWRAQPDAAPYAHSCRRIPCYGRPMDRLRCSVATSRTAVRVRAEVAVRHRRMVTEISGCRQLRPTAATARRSCSRRVRLLPVADGQVDRPRGARRQWDGHDLAALRVIVSVRCPRSRPRCSMSAPVASDTGSPFSASREISACSHDGPSPAARRARCVQGDGVRLIVHPRTADVRGGRVLQEFLFDGVLVTGNPAIVHTLQIAEYLLVRRDVCDQVRALRSPRYGRGAHCYAMLRAQPVHLGCLVDPGRPPLPGFGSPGPAGWPVGHDEVSGDQAYVTSPDEVAVS